MAALFDTYWQGSKGNGRAPIEAVHQYVDEHDRLLFEVVRRRDKTFAQRHWDGAGGFVWKPGDTRRALYRLPAVIAAVERGATVYVCEGEKDVHAIEQAGAVATCDLGGAGKRRAECAETLRGARVIVVADRDEPGYRHAAKSRRRSMASRPRSSRRSPRSCGTPAALVGSTSRCRSRSRRNRLGGAGQEPRAGPQSLPRSTFPSPLR